MFLYFNSLHERYCNIFIGMHNLCWIYILGLVSVLTNAAFSSGALRCKWRSRLSWGESWSGFLGQREGTVTRDLSLMLFLFAGSGGPNSPRPEPLSAGTADRFTPSCLNKAQERGRLSPDSLSMPFIQFWHNLLESRGIVSEQASLAAWQIDRELSWFHLFFFSFFFFLNGAFLPLASLSSIIGVMTPDAEIASSWISIARSRLFNLCAVSQLFILLQNSPVFLVTHGTLAIWILFSRGRTPAGSLTPQVLKWDLGNLWHLGSNPAAWNEAKFSWSFLSKYYMSTQKLQTCRLTVWCVRKSHTLP